MIGACDSFAGDDGLLQNVPCTSRSGQSVAATQACQTLCPDPRFVPNSGGYYISKINGVTNVPADIQMGVDVGPQDAFKCMALVGDAGCGIEGQLEGAKRALDGHRVENTGFLRDSSTLAVVFITDEDDCSVPVSQRSTNNPLTRDCTGSTSQTLTDDCFNVDYRCIATDVQCTQSMIVEGAKTGCQERADSRLTAIQQYVSLFTGLRPPNRLLVSGIWTPPIAGASPPISIGTGPFNTKLLTAGIGTAGMNRDIMTNAGCYYAADSTIFGQAQLRLSKFAAQIPGSIQVSICDIANYSTALDQIGSAIVQKVEVSCLGLSPKRDGSGQPECVVGDVPANAPNVLPSVGFPTCSAGCCSAWAGSAQPNVTDPGIQTACAGETTDACYCAVPSRIANVCVGTAVAGVWRKNGASPPANTVTNFVCAPAVAASCG